MNQDGNGSSFATGFTDSVISAVSPSSSAPGSGGGGSGGGSVAEVAVEAAAGNLATVNLFGLTPRALNL